MSGEINFTITNTIIETSVTDAGVDVEIINQPIEVQLFNGIAPPALDSYVQESDLADVAFSGDYDDLSNKPSIPTQYTDEMAQDAVGGILTDTAEINLSYNDSTNQITADFTTSVRASLAKADSALQDLSGLTTDDLAESATNKYWTNSRIASALAPYVTSAALALALAPYALSADLGSAAYEDVGYFATAAQGALADTALQPGDLAGYATESYVDSGLSLKLNLDGSNASEDIDIGAFSLNAGSIKVNGTNGAGHIHLKHQASDAPSQANSTTLFANANGDLKYKNDSLYYTTFATSANTDDRVYTFPDASGIIALTSDLSAYVPYMGATQALNMNQQSITNTGNLGLYDGANLAVGDFYLEGDRYRFLTSDENPAMLDAGKLSLRDQNNASATGYLTLTDVYYDFLDNVNNHAVLRTGGVQFWDVMNSAFTTLNVTTSGSSELEYKNEFGSYLPIHMGATWLYDSQGGGTTGVMVYSDGDFRFNDNGGNPVPISHSTSYFYDAAQGSRGSINLEDDVFAFLTSSFAPAAISAGIIYSNYIYAQSGSASIPSISFDGNVDTGIFLVGTNQLGFSTGGVHHWSITSAGNLAPNGAKTISAALVHSAGVSGSAAAPIFSFGFGLDTDTGMYRAGADTLGFSTGGTERLRIGATTGQVGINRSSGQVGMLDIVTNGSLANTVPAVVAGKAVTSGNSIGASFRNFTTTTGNAIIEIAGLNAGAARASQIGTDSSGNLTLYAGSTTFGTLGTAGLRLSSAAQVLAKQGGTTNLSGVMTTAWASSSAIGNVGVGEDDLRSFTLAASTLNNSGDTIYFDATGLFAANANNKRVRAYFGGTLIFDTTSLALNGGNWRMQGKICRTSFASADIIVTWTSSNTLLTISQTYTAFLGNLLAANILKLTAEATADNDVTQRNFQVYWQPS